MSGISVPLPPASLRSLSEYPYYRVLRDNIDVSNPLPAGRLNLYLRTHPHTKLTYDDARNLHP